MLRYLPWFPDRLREALRSITLGEGFTATVSSAGLVSGSLPTGWVKMEQLMPTASFKDRGAAVLIALARMAGASRVVQDSSGNAGHSVATYAARAGIPCDIFLPESVKPQKVSLMKALGANVRVIRGSREEAADAALHEVGSTKAFYASHVYNPIFYEGTSTFFFELAEQLHSVPTQVFLPLGNGTLVLGAARAFERMRAADGFLSRDRSLPKLVAVQASRCAPIAEALQAGRPTVAEITAKPTLADGIAIARPARGAQVIKVIREWQGAIETVSEELIDPAHKRLLQHGLHVEPTTAATFAAIEQRAIDAAHAGVEFGRWVAPVCAAGWKA